MAQLQLEEGSKAGPQQVQTLTWWWPPPDLSVVSTSGKKLISTPRPYSSICLSPLGQDPSHNSTTSLGTWETGVACPVLRPCTNLGDAESAACVDRKCSTTSGLDSQPLFLGAFCPLRQPISKTTPCTALQRGPHQKASPTGPSLLRVVPKFKVSSWSPKAEPTREWGCSQFRWPCWPSSGGFR